MRPVILLSFALVLSGCSSAGDIALKTAENIGRAACTAARNCANTCPDGSAASPQTYSCAKARP